MSELERLKESASETIYLIPMSEEGSLHYVWCDDPAPQEGMLESEAIEYVRRDKYDALASENDSIWETLIKVADMLGIDPVEARKIPGKPSAVYSSHLTQRDDEQFRQGFWWGFERARCHPDQMNIQSEYQEVAALRQHRRQTEEDANERPDHQPSVRHA